MNQEAVLAGIVTYNPDLKRLKENLRSIEGQVDDSIIVDNASSNVSEIEELANRFNAQIIKFPENKGIAVALTEIMNFADMNGFGWVVTLDQDSVSPSNMVERYIKYADMEDVAMISPVIVDRNSKKVIHGEQDYEYIDRCITSGAMTRTADWKSLKMTPRGGYNETLFIDYVDFDLCAQFKVIEKKIIRVNSVLFSHEIGKAEDHSSFGRLIPVGNHSAQRKYYITRNQLYYIKKYRRYIDVKREYKYLAELFAWVILFESDKMQKLKMMIKGIRDSSKIM